ncbi:serine/threonine-protein kinase [Pedobacter sp. P351]|uniref:serine/threonine protein kinase n=1 Tax=Pedobacter superstes TaxID=3133441 RepID=UPI0030B4A46F
MARIFTITEGLENMGALRTGGQGSVYKGRRTGHIITAVKLLPTPIHAEDENDKNFRDFQNEVIKLKKVNEEPNPNVVKILNSGITESGSLPFIEMEFIEGPDLEELLKSPHDSVFSIREAIKVADQLSNALAHCHKVSVKHGDIKSNNVKLNIHSGNYMLLDFGLAIMSDEQRRTSLRHAGAIEFMAPEQNNGEMLFETDVYSFGVILYELIAGTVPFPLHDKGETSRNAVMISHLEMPVPDILELRRKNLPPNWSDEKKAHEMMVPGWLISIIAKCLEKRPENRFKNGIELHKAIVLNSTIPIADNSNSTAGNFAALQEENKRLKSLLASQENTKTSKEAGYALNSEGRSKRMSGSILGGLKPVVIGLIILFSCLSLFAGFSFFNNQEPAIDTVALHAEKQQLRDSITYLERLNDKRLQDSIDHAKRISALKAQIAEQEKQTQFVSEEPEPENNGKKKKKKFFDIIFEKR